MTYNITEMYESTIAELDIIKAENEYLREQLIKKDLELQKANNVELDPWKGKTTLKIENNEEFFKVTEFKKSHKDDKPREVSHLIRKKWVSVLWSILKKYGGEKTTLKEVSSYIIKYYGLKHNGWGELYGERNEYLKLMYFPAKILDSKNYIEYKGRFISCLK